MGNLDNITTLAVLGALGFGAYYLYKTGVFGLGNAVSDTISGITTFFTPPSNSSSGFLNSNSSSSDYTQTLWTWVNPSASAADATIQSGILGGLTFNPLLTLQNIWNWNAQQNSSPAVPDLQNRSVYCMQKYGSNPSKIGLCQIGAIN